MTVTTAAMRNDTQTVVEADHLVLLRLLLVLLATFGLNRIPNLLSRNFLDKRSGPKCTVASFYCQVAGIALASSSRVIWRKNLW